MWLVLKCSRSLKLPVMKVAPLPRVPTTLFEAVTRVTNNICIFMIFQMQLNLRSSEPHSASLVRVTNPGFFMGDEPPQAYYSILCPIDLKIGLEWYD